MAQEGLIPLLDLENRFVSVAALHTQDETGRSVVMEAGGDFLLTVKNNQPTLRANVAKKLPAPAAGFPPEEPTPTQARTPEQNKGRAEKRAIHTAPISSEDVGFPFAAQGARLLRQTEGRKDEEVVLPTAFS